MSPEVPPSSSEPSSLLVYSSKPPEEVRLFGLRGNDIERVMAQAEEETPVSPEERGFTTTNEDGVCKYCQLMLHPEAPKIIEHQPNIQKLIDSSCQFCGWIQVSIAQGLPELASSYSKGDPDLHDPDSSSTKVTISMSRAATYARLIPTVGPRGHFAPQGLPLNSTTISQLGDAASRMFWKLHDTDDRPPHARLSVLKTWVYECLEHKDCCSGLSASDVRKFPTRILDLTGSPDIASSTEDIKIRLRETSEEEMGKYVALSYCWGQNPKYHFTTTQKTLDERKSGIDYASLPPVHQDAILATLFLGLRYLWIDSVCIIQDSSQDWQIEAAKMSSVYSNSYLTLAATSSESPEDPLFQTLDLASYTSLNGETALFRIETHGAIDSASEPLNTRAWTLQEAVLSTRTVCFGSKQWLWKCPSRFTTEDSLIDGPPPTENRVNQWARTNRQDSGADGQSYLKNWYQLVSNYSKRNLTYQSDKLKAIAGLADVFAKQTGYQYVAGLWAEDLAAGLLWQTTSRGVTRDPNGVASWSWASVKGELLNVGFTGESETSVPLIKLVNIEQEWDGIPLSSQLRVARLTVAGKLLQVSLGKRSITRTLRYHLIPSPGSEEIFGECFLDNLTPIEQNISTVFCLPLYSYQQEAAELEYYVLVLVPAPDQDKEGSINAYRRVGMGVVWHKSKFNNGDENGNEIMAKAESTSLVLV